MLACNSMLLESRMFGSLSPISKAGVLYHYCQEVLCQLYWVLGSADFLGNPVGLFTNVSSGVVDMFYEPWQGVVMHSNTQLGIGIAKVCDPVRDTGLFT